MQRRIWGQYHTIKGEDLTEIGLLTQEAINALAWGFGPGRLTGFTASGVGTSTVTVSAGWAVVYGTSGDLVLVHLPSDLSIDLTGRAAGPYDIVFTPVEEDVLIEQINPPPQYLASGQPNPFYDSRFSPYNLVTKKRWTVNMTVQPSPYTPGVGETVLATVQFDGSVITDTTQVLDLPASAVADGSITGVKLNEAVAGNGLAFDVNHNLYVKVDDITIEIVSDVLKVKAQAIDDTYVPTSNTLELYDALSGLANRIKAATGESDWKANPATTIAELDANAARKTVNETISASWAFTSEVSINRLRITSTSDVNPTSTAHGLQIGFDSGQNLRIDVNEILALNNGTPTNFYLQNEGGRVWVNGLISADGRSPIIVGSEAYPVWHKGNDGAGSGLDADLLDGYDSSDFPRKAENATVSGSWTFSNHQTFTLNIYQRNTSGDGFILHPRGASGYDFWQVAPSNAGTIDWLRGIKVHRDTNLTELLDNTTVGGTFNVAGATTLNSTLTVSGGATLNSTLDVSGVLTVNNSAVVTGSVTATSIYGRNTGVLILDAQNYGMEFRIDADGTGSDSYKWLSNGATIATLRATGQMGIGVASPTEKLEVAGRIVADDLIFNSNSLDKRISHQGTKVVLGNNDWTSLIYKTTGTPPTYDQANRGVKFTGPSAWAFVRTRIPVHPDRVYRVKGKATKLSGDGYFYVGAVSLDGDYTELKTDQANSYNYFGAEHAPISVGSSYYFEGTIAGYNATTDSDYHRFDPEAKYFDLVIIGNYNATQTPSETVVEWIVLEEIAPFQEGATINTYMIGEERDSSSTKGAIHLAASSADTIDALVYSKAGATKAVLDASGRFQSAYSGGPAFTFFGDDNTGVGQVAADTGGLWAAGVKVLEWNSGKNTAYRDLYLDVNGGIANGVVVDITSASSGWARGMTVNDNGTRLAGAGFYGVAGSVYSWRVGLDSSWWSNYVLSVDTNGLTVRPAAAYGIQPGITLIDQGSGSGEGAAIDWQVGDHAGVTLARVVGVSESTGGSLRFYTNAADSGSPTERMRITSTGNVGINTTSPAATLDVNGSFSAGDASVSTLSTSGDLSVGGRVKSAYFGGAMRWGSGNFSTTTLPVSSKSVNLLLITQPFLVEKWDPNTSTWTSVSGDFSGLTDSGSTAWSSGTLSPDGSIVEERYRFYYQIPGPVYADLIFRIGGQHVVSADIVIEADSSSAFTSPVQVADPVNNVGLWDTAIEIPSNTYISGREYFRFDITLRTNNTSLPISLNEISIFKHGSTGVDLRESWFVKWGPHGELILRTPGDASFPAITFDANQTTGIYMGSNGTLRLSANNSSGVTGRGLAVNDNYVYIYNTLQVKNIEPHSSNPSDLTISSGNGYDIVFALETSWSYSPSWVRYVRHDGSEIARIGYDSTYKLWVMNIGDDPYLYHNGSPYYDFFDTNQDLIVQVVHDKQAVLSMVSGLNTNGATLAGIYFGRKGGYSSSNRNLTGILGIQDGTGSHAGAHLAFHTTASGSTPSEKMRINGNGNVGIGTTTPSYKLEVAGSVGATSFVNTSTRQAKEDIEPFSQSALGIIGSLEVKQFKYRKEYGGDGRVNVGIIAEETPDLLLGSDKKSVSLNTIVGVLIKAVQELSQRIKELEEKGED